MIQDNVYIKKLKILTFNFPKYAKSIEDFFPNSNSIEYFLWFASLLNLSPITGEQQN